MSDGYRIGLVLLALGFFVSSWTAEATLMPRLAQIIGHMRVRIQTNYRKKRRQYKKLLEEMGL